METFLQHVARDIVARYGTRLNRVAIVFPNKRASLFLNKHLAQAVSHPMWSPAYVTISDLFRRQSPLTVADPIKLVCDLHKSFTLQTGIDETLDHFYSWGQLLLADFDDIDKNMADADQVFSNLSNLHEMDGADYLTAEQRQALTRFFSNFTEDHSTLLKERFLKLWSHMSDIYHDFNERLLAQQLCYEGALYRRVATAERLHTDHDVYLFVGFNRLSRVEQRLFDKLKRQGKARFYWDYDHYYMKDGEAGHYIGRQMADLPNEFDADRDDIFRVFDSPKDITYVSAATDNIQARYVSTWLRDRNRIDDGHRTAIVLCDESLLPAVVHCLPPEVGKVNVTSGYPLIQSPVASLVTLLINLQTTGYDANRQRFRLRHVAALLRHPCLSPVSAEAKPLLQMLSDRRIYYPTPQMLGADDTLSLVFTPFDDRPTNSALLEWMCNVVKRTAALPSEDAANDTRQTWRTSAFAVESAFRTYTLLNRLRTLADSGDLQVDVTTLRRLITQLMQTTAVPFHGEPAEGIQIMGLLETRNLDFDHLLVLSAGEGNLPRGLNDASFIPYNIRKAHNLTTADHKEAIFAYHFYRLLQRSTDITVVYNNSTADGHTGEMSRFMLQLMVEGPHKTAFSTLQAPQRLTPFCPRPVEKTTDVMRRLVQRFSTDHRDSATPLLTPTAINRYMRCQLTFYYNYVYGLTEPETTDEDLIDNRTFGNIFHEASNLVYTKLMSLGNPVQARDIEAMLRSRVDIERAVDEAFRKELFGTDTPHAGFRPELNGLQIINREVLIHYLRRLLQIDQRQAPFEVLGLETDVVAHIATRHLQTTIGGRIDRLDRVGHRIRVIDYKTGSRVVAPLTDVDAIFDPASLSRHSDYYLQTMLYACIVGKSHPAEAVSPAIIYIQHAQGNDYDPTLLFGREPIADIRRDRQRFAELLTEKIDEMFDPDRPFTPTADRNLCNQCPYRTLCR